MTTHLVLDALDQTVWTRQRDGHDDFTELVHHSDRGSQYTSITLSERLAETGIDMPGRFTPRTRTTSQPTTTSPAP